LVTDKASFTVPRKKQTAFIVFQGGANRGNIPAWFTKPGWRHCWLMLPAYYPEPGLMAEVFTMKIESLYWGVDTAVWWRSPEVVASAFMEAGATAIVEFPFTTPPANPSRTWRGQMNCVTLTKAALLIDDWKVWTPKQLFAYLVRHGGRLYQP
jgi:hypothetical protein